MSVVSVSKGKFVEVSPCYFKFDDLGLTCPPPESSKRISMVRLLTRPPPELMQIVGKSFNFLPPYSKRIVEEKPCRSGLLIVSKGRYVEVDPCLFKFDDIGLTEPK